MTISFCFKSANASIYTENVLESACSIPSDSELGSLFTLINRIKQNECITNAKNSVVYRTSMDRLKTYWVICSRKRKSLREIFCLFFLLSHGNTWQFVHNITNWWKTCRQRSIFLFYIIQAMSLLNWFEKNSRRLFW